MKPQEQYYVWKVYIEERLVDPYVEGFGNDYYNLQFETRDKAIKALIDDLEEQAREKNWVLCLQITTPLERKYNGSSI